jgi:RimJ/RimL family protein N-acetyltransferase
MTNNKPRYLSLGSIGKPELGYITVAEYQKDIPFDIKRVYWTYYTPNQVTRGHHAHKALQQCIFAVSGRIEFKLINANGEESHFVLDSPEKGLYIPPMHWRTIKFSHNAVLLCLASEIYIEEDYIRDFKEFKPMSLKFVDFSKDILDLSWDWLNDEQTKYLTNTPNFSKDDQLKWFDSLPNKDYFIKGIQCDGIKIGVVGLKKITNMNAEYWGYIGEKEYRGRGIGKMMLDFILLKCKDLGLDNVYLKVVKDNFPAIYLYEKKGFKISKEVNNEYIMTKNINV